MGLTGNSRAVDALPPQLTPAHVHTHAHGGHHRAATFTGGIGEQGKIFACELPPRRPIVMNNRHDPARAKATGGALWTIVCGPPPKKTLVTTEQTSLVTARHLLSLSVPRVAPAGGTPHAPDGRARD